MRAGWRVIRGRPTRGGTLNFTAGAPRRPPSARNQRSSSAASQPSVRLSSGASRVWKLHTAGVCGSAQNVQCPSVPTTRHVLVCAAMLYILPPPSAPGPPSPWDLINNHSARGPKKAQPQSIPRHKVRMIVRNLDTPKPPAPVQPRPSRTPRRHKTLRLKVTHPLISCSEKIEF